jgi:hypothetical protein
VEMGDGQAFGLGVGVGVKDDVDVMVVVRMSARTRFSRRSLGRIVSCCV